MLVWAWSFKKILSFSFKYSIKKEVSSLYFIWLLYNFDKGKTNGFLIENSHGKEEKGFNENYYMSLNWFYEYVYKIVVDKKFVNSKIIKSLNKKPTTLPFWSPFGSLMKGGIIDYNY